MSYHSTTLAVGAQELCAQSTDPSATALGRIADQPYFAPVLRRDLIGALATLARELGIRPATLAVLDAMLSFLPCKDASGRDAPVTPLHLLTVYAANDTIGFRSRGLTDRQLRRHFEVLESKGLMQRRDSANGKRFPIYKGGKVIGAYGLDLSPLFARSGALIARAAELRQEQQETRGIIAQILQLRRQLLETPLPDLLRDMVEAMRNLTRRVTLSKREAEGILAKLHALYCPQTATIHTDPAPEPLPNTKEKPASDGQNVRHNEQTKSDLKKITSAQPPEEIEADWQSFTTLAIYYPQEPRSSHEMTMLLASCAAMLRIDTGLWQRALLKLQPQQLLQLLDQILARFDDLDNPSAYLAAILRGQSRVT